VTGVRNSAIYTSLCQIEVLGLVEELLVDSCPA
jgi:hypothetical protein